MRRQNYLQPFFFIHLNRIFSGQLLFAVVIGLGIIILWQAFRHRSIYNEHCQEGSRYTIRVAGRIKSETLTESSGLAYWKNGLFFSHNDDTDSRLYALDTLGNVHQTLELPTVNRDWEEICTDGEGRFFIGNFGNNLAADRSLTILIYRPESEKLDSLIFLYDEGNGEGYHSKFDCEAMIYDRDSLFIFTKDRFENESLVFVLPAKAGRHLARYKTTLFINGMVTGAALSPDKKELALLTYGKVYFANVQSGWINIPQPDRCFAWWPLRQSEAISYIDKNRLLISNEQGILFILTKK